MHVAVEVLGTLGKEIKLEQLLDIAAGNPCRVAVVCPCCEAAMQGVSLVRERGAAQCELFVPREEPPTAADAHLEEALRDAIESGAEALVNVGVPLRLLWPKVLALRRKGWMSGVSVVEMPGRGRLLLIADGLLIVSPTLEQRVSIVENAIHVAHALGIEQPRVALLAATESVNPKSRVSLEAAQITMMNRRGQIKGAIVDGPLGFDNAISAHAARVKGIVSEVAGQVDVLIAPDLEAGNLLLKTLTHLCGGRAVNAVVGGRMPVVLTAPDDTADTYAAAIALGVVLARANRDR